MNLLYIINEEILVNEEILLLEGFLNENPNQARKFLKEKNLDPITNPNGQKIFNAITGITRGDGYTYLLTRFYVNERMPVDDLKKLHEYLRQNKEFVTRLPKQVATYDNYRELRRDLDAMEGNRALKKLYNELPAALKQQQQSLPVIEQQKLKELAQKFNILTPEQQTFFMSKVSGYKEIRLFIENLENYINAIENSEDYDAKKQKIENTLDAYVAYDNPEQKILIAFIDSFDASKALGCTSKWCITRNIGSWNNYKKGGNKYFFIWDFNYPAEDVNSLIGVAYNRKDNSSSRTHLKDDVYVKLDNIIKSKHLNYNIFNNYIDDYNENRAREYETASGIFAALRDYSNDTETLIEMIRASDFIKENSDPDKVRSDYYGDIELGLTEKEMIDIFELGEFGYINQEANSDAEEYIDDDELNYMHNTLSQDNINLLKELAKKLGWSKIKYDAFGDEGLINEFLEKYELTDISDTYKEELSTAKGEAKRDEAKKLISEIPFDVPRGEFNVKTMIDYIIENNIKAETFDELILKLKDELPELSYEALYETGDYDSDALNLEIKNDLERKIISLNDVDSDFYHQVYAVKNINDELTKLKFDMDTSWPTKVLDNMTISIEDSGYVDDEPYVTARIVYNQDYYKNLNQKPPVSKIVKIPLSKLINYVGQHALRLESVIKKLVLEESYDIKLNHITEEIQSLIEGIEVFHGSDNKFEDFDMDKIGSSGKSLGGWGIYFSDDENVSKRYYTKTGFLKQYEIEDGNYFDLDQPIDDGQRIMRGLQRLGIDDSEIEEFQTDYIDYDTTNKQAYEWLAYVLGGEKQASEFLKSLGYIGNTMMDKWENDARNYIVFDTSSIIQ